MVRAGALLMSVAMATVIAMFSGFLILMAYHFKQQESLLLSQKKLAANARSGIEWLLASTSAEASSQYVDLFGQGSDSVLLQQRYWGAYSLLSSTAMSAGAQVHQMALCGAALSADESTALYLADLGRPLHVCGNTRLQGTSYLPEAGIRHGYIQGRGYTGSSLLYGTSRRSQASLPPLQGKALEALHQYRYAAATMSAADLPDTLHHSFSDSTLVIDGGKNLRLGNVHWTGNLVIRADSLLVVGAGATLNQVLLIAGSIVLEPQVRGAFQAFASDSLVVKKGVALSYPSVLGLCRQRSYTFQPFVRVEEGASVKGFVFSWVAPAVVADLKTWIDLRPNSLVEGEVYAEGNAQLAGEVRGSVYCFRIVLRSPSASYENHLLDAVVDAKARSPLWVSHALMEKDGYKK
ncbi:MAG: hypothetical protein MUF42_17690 [Cytophagaceae bacterium]|jgi:hypothetical protein|nr:hypothetical protein [Cytophagaceae bacterium]